MKKAQLLLFANTSAAESQTVSCLEAAGYEVQVATRLESARQALQDGIDLVLIDNDAANPGTADLASSLRASASRKHVVVIHLATPDSRQIAKDSRNTLDFVLQNNAPSALQPLVDAALRAQAAERLKDDFLSTLAHELRTPLNSIMGWADILLRQPREADFSQGLQAIERNARLQAQLIADLLDVSRMMSGTLELDCSRIEPGFVIDGAIRSASAAAQARQIRIELRGPQTLLEVDADAERLQQVIASLLSNAVKFSAKNSVVVVDAQCSDHELKISVTDHGRGIAPEALPDVMDRFRRAGRSRGGLGLGLTLARHLIALHGGRLDAHSDGVGQGARFTVHLPLPGKRTAAKM